MTTNEDTPWLLTVMTFYAETALPEPLPDALPELSLPPVFGRYLLLADDDASYLCVDTESNGAVVCVDPPQEQPGRFVNSGAAQFAAYVQVYAGMSGPEQARGASKETLKGWADQLRADMTAIDPIALSDSDYWWSLILEELDLYTT